MADSSSQGTYHYALYRYTPSVPAGAIFAVVFGLLAIVHTFCFIRHRTMFWIPFVIGLLFEIAGYIARIFSHYDTEALGPYIAQSILILIAAPLFAASIYMTLGRLIVRLDAEEASLVPVKWLTKVFVAGDVISWLLQAAGGGYMAAGSLNAMKMGENIVIGGLAVQLLFFGFFVLVAALFHWRMTSRASSSSTKVPEVRSHSSGSQFSVSWSWGSLMWALYAACVLILVRSVFRVVEFVQGNDGYSMSHEFLLYIFDALLMALSGIVLAVVFPGSLLRRAHQGEGYEEAYSMSTSTSSRPLL